MCWCLKKQKQQWLNLWRCPIKSSEELTRYTPVLAEMDKEQGKITWLLAEFKLQQIMFTYSATTIFIVKVKDQ